MKKYYYLLLIFLLVSCSFIKSQQLPRDIILSEFIPKARTNDLLYVNDTVVYLMSKSPLEALPGYNDLYASFNLPQVVGQPWMPLGVRVNRPAAYHAIWCLRDGMLYLSDIDISNASFCEYKSFFPNNEQYNLMEGFSRLREGIPPNNLLNYGYAILRAVVARSLVASGLLPTFGIHHRNKYNAYCLADDIMEPYRPFVDKMVCDIVAEKRNINELTQDIKFKLLNIPVLDVVIDDQRSPLMVAVGQTSASLYKCYEGSLRRVKYPSFE